MFGRGWVSWLGSCLTVAVVAASCGQDAKDAPSMTDGGSANSAGAGGALPLAGSREPDATEGGTRLGVRCAKDADCGDPLLRCLDANQGYMDGQGAPAGGICTADCAADDDCLPFDAHGTCVTLGELPLFGQYSSKPVPRLCMAGCSLGAPAGDTKCHGRDDLACRPFAPFPVTTCPQRDPHCPSGTFCYRGVCRELGCGPRCNADSDCSAGRVCNPLSGLCDREPSAPVPVGLDCPGDQDPSSVVCGAGLCLTVEVAQAHVKNMCTLSCTLGQSCGEDGVCAFPRFPDFAAGDAAYCLQRCDCDSQCRHPADKCLPWNDETLERHFGSLGACNYAAPGAESLPSCEGGAGGAPSTGSGGADGNSETAGQGGR